MKGGGTSVAPIYAGVRTDIEKLLEKFLEKPSVRYEHFQKCFKETKFSLIYCGRNTENELRENDRESLSFCQKAEKKSHIKFAEKIMAVALSYCFPPYSFQAQVGGTYLLYALYYLQAPKYRMKIRVTEPMLKGLVAFLEALKAESHLDSCYVITRLLYDDAFQICMYPEEHNPMTFRRFDCKDDLDRATKTLRNGKSTMGDVTEDKLFGQLTTLHTQYVNLKTSLFHGGEHLPQALTLVFSSLPEYVDSAVKDCEDKLERRFGKKGKGKETNGAESSEPSSAIGSPKKRKSGDRAEIRNRAYATVTHQGRFQRKKKQSKEQ